MNREEFKALAIVLTKPSVDWLRRRFTRIKTAALSPPEEYLSIETELLVLLKSKFPTMDVKSVPDLDVNRIGSRIFVGKYEVAFLNTANVKILNDFYNQRMHRSTGN